MKTFDAFDTRIAPIVAVSGAEGTRKTGFALTFPPPVRMFIFDPGTEPTIYTMLKLGIIKEPPQYETFLLPPDMSKPEAVGGVSDAGIREAKKLYSKFQQEFTTILAGPDEGTIIFDTETQFWQLVRRAFVMDDATFINKDNKMYLMRTSYAKPNQMYEGIIDQIAFGKKNTSVVFISRAKAKYNAQGQETDLMVPDRQGRLGYLADIDLYFTKDMVKDGAKWKPKYLAEVRKSKWDDTMLYATFENPSYEYVKDFLLP